MAVRASERYLEVLSDAGTPLRPPVSPVRAVERYLEVLSDAGTPLLVPANPVRAVERYLEVLTPAGAPTGAVPVNPVRTSERYLEVLTAATTRVVVLGDTLTLTEAAFPAIPVALTDDFHLVYDLLLPGVVVEATEAWSATETLHIALIPPPGPLLVPALAVLVDASAVAELAPPGVSGLEPITDASQVILTLTGLTLAVDLDELTDASQVTLRQRFTGSVAVEVLTDASIVTLTLGGGVGDGVIGSLGSDPLVADISVSDNPPLSFGFYTRAALALLDEAGVAPPAALEVADPDASEDQEEPWV